MLPLHHVLFVQQVNILLQDWLLVKRVPMERIHRLVQDLVVIVHLVVTRSMDHLVVQLV